MNCHVLQAVLTAFSLGTLSGPPRPLSGGLMHTTYRVETDRGVWVLKRLNPAVAGRPGALGNIRRAEQAARALARFVPSVTALTREDDPIFCQNGQYFLLFPWQEGVSVFPPELTPAHCAAIGAILGRIHSAKLTLPGFPLPEYGEGPDWNALEEAARRFRQPWADAFLAALPQCARLYEKARRACVRMRVGCVLSHGDLDPKNVLWANKKPVLIDWEAAGPIHPALDAFTLLRDWTGDGQGGILLPQFRAMLDAYRAACPAAGLPWEEAALAAAESILAWLAYNVRRACAIDTADPAVQAAGAEQVTETLRTLASYESCAQRMLCLLNAPGF